MKRDDGADAVQYKVWEIIPTLGGGGAEKMVLDLSEGLQDSRYDVTVISLYDKSFATSGRVRFAEDNHLKVNYLNKKQGFDFHLLLRLAGMIRSEKPDIIHTHIESFQYIAILGFFFRFVHIHTMHSVAGREPKIYRMLLKSAGKRHRTDFAVLSNQIMESMQELFGTQEERLRCIKNGVDTDFYQFKSRKINSESVRLLSVGSLIPVKNHHMLLEAFEELEKQRNYRDSLTIVGDGKLRNQLEKTAVKLGINKNVTFTGNVEDVRPLLYHADIFVMTSHYEGVSLALLEAASTGMPIIVSATGATPELVGDDAILFEDNQKEQLVSALQNLMNDSELYELQSEKSRELAVKHSKKKMVDRYMDLYADTLERNK